MVALLKAANAYVQTQAGYPKPILKGLKAQGAKTKSDTSRLNAALQQAASPLGIGERPSKTAKSAGKKQRRTLEQPAPEIKKQRSSAPILIPIAPAELTAHVISADAAQRLSTPVSVETSTNVSKSPPSEAPAGSATKEPEKAARPEQAKSSENAETPPQIDFDALATNVADFIGEAGKAAAAYIRPRERGEKPLVQTEELAGVFKTLGKIAEHWLSDPQRTLQAQTRLTSSFWSLWSAMMQKGQGQDVPAVRAPDPKDGRFKDPEWTANPYFDFLKQAYLITSGWAEDMVREAEAIDPKTRQQAEFYLRQIASAVSPSNFIATNPELLRTTFRENGANLTRGMRMMAEDIEAGHGDLKVRQSKTEGFKVGVNMGTTPGKVVFRNHLIELLQYTATTPQVLRVPLVIVPPWINKFYVLDLNPEKSFIRWCVAQGITVFVVSWVNPDERHASADFETYMHDGVIAAVETACAITGETQAHTLGYCVGGTMLSVTLAWLAAKNRNIIASSTLLTTQVDFENAGDLKIFVDDAQISSIEQTMAKTGYLPGTQMASAFNMLRPQDLIWPYVINAYLKGQEPGAFDLLYWNSDSTRMPQANHSFYLRNCYLDNKLSKGEMVVGGVRLDLGKVKSPIYNLATKEDHIAPALSVFVGSSRFGGPVRYVLGGSGHIAGVVNPADKAKYQYWTGGPAVGRFEDWLSAARETPGSWWLDWVAWVNTINSEVVPARSPGSAEFAPLGDAPGTYVLVRA
jgi:polyhydroxyalkanoate synthase subunit PhaC